MIPLFGDKMFNGKFQKGDRHPLYGKHLSDEYKKKISKALCGHFVSEATKKKIGFANKGKYPSREVKTKMSEAQKGQKHWRWCEKIEFICQVCGKEKYITPSRIKHGKGVCCSKKCVGIWSMKQARKKDTIIERLIENELIKRGIPYTKQVALLGVTLVDFLLPRDIIIYCDGEYWHNKTNVKHRDANQNFILTFYGYKVFRFTGIEIKKSPTKCINKICRTHDELVWGREKTG